MRANNNRLLDYVRNGGTLIVQYNKFEFNQQQFGPYRASVSGNRVSDETAPVKVLVPEHPLFNVPNKRTVLQRNTTISPVDVGGVGSTCPAGTPAGTFCAAQLGNITELQSPRVWRFGARINF